MANEMQNNMWQAVNIALQTGRVPALLWGEPGIGKTQRIAQMAASHDFFMEIIIASTRDPSDFSGLPYRTDSGVAMSPPAWAIRANEATKKHPMSVVFLDEISTAPPSVQAAVLRIFGEKVAGEYKMNDQVALIAAANPPECAAGGWELAPPMANRFAHFSVEPDADAWVKWALSGQNDKSQKWPRLPKGWDDGIRAQLGIISAYVQTRPQALHQMPGGKHSNSKEDADAGRAWASPRSWHNSAILLAACEAVGATNDIKQVSIAATIGAANALEYLTWRRNLDLPDPAEVLKNPKLITEKILKRADLIWATMSSVVSYVVSESQKNPDIWYKSWDVMGKLLEANKKDLVTVFATPLFRAKPADLKKVPAILTELMPYLKENHIIS